MTDAFPTKLCATSLNTGADWPERDSPISHFRLAVATPFRSLSGTDKTGLFLGFGLFQHSHLCRLFNAAVAFIFRYYSFTRFKIVRTSPFTTTPLAQNQSRPSLSSSNSLFSCSTESDHIPRKKLTSSTNLVPPLTTPHCPDGRRDCPSFFRSFLLFYNSSVFAISLVKSSFFDLRDVALSAIFVLRSVAQQG